MGNLMTGEEETINDNIKDVIQNILLEERYDDDQDNDNISLEFIDAFAINDKFKEKKKRHYPPPP